MLILTTFEEQLPYGSGVRSARTWLGLPQLEASMTQEVLASRLATGQPAVARLERDRHRTNPDSIDRYAVGYDSAIVIEQKWLV